MATPTTPTIQQLLADAAALSEAITAFQVADDTTAKAQQAASQADAASTTARAARAAANQGMLAAQQALDADLAAYEAAQTPTPPVAVAP